MIGYPGAARRLRHRGDRWSLWRDAAWSAAVVLTALTLLAPLPGGPFTVHMTQHLVLGMVVPLLVVLARPVTLALRVLRPGRVRRTVVAAAGSRPAAVLLLPPVAALLDVGGLWVLYRSGLLAATHHRPWLHVLIHVHVLMAGVLFTAAVCRLEPVGRRRLLDGFAVRAATLVAAAAAHAVLAKTLYAAGPPGTDFGAADLRAGALLMYYGGDVIEIALAAVIAAQWYRAGGRALARERRLSGAGRQRSPSATAPTV